MPAAAVSIPTDVAIVGAGPAGHTAVAAAGPGACNTWTVPRRDPLLARFLFGLLAGAESPGATFRPRILLRLLVG